MQKKWALLGVTLALAAGTAAAADLDCSVKGGLQFTPGVEVIKAMRSYTGADGQTHVEQIDVKGKTGSYFHNKTVLTQFDLGAPERAVIVYGHPNMEIPQHPAPYPEKFLIIAGSSTMTLPSGEVYHLEPGTLFIAEDTTGTGRSGAAGPCGYVAVDFQYKKEAR